MSLGSAQPVSTRERDGKNGNKEIKRWKTGIQGILLWGRAHVACLYAFCRFRVHLKPLWRPDHQVLLTPTVTRWNRFSFMCKYSEPESLQVNNPDLQHSWATDRLLQKKRVLQMRMNVKRASHGNNSLSQFIRQHWTGSLRSVSDILNRFCTLLMLPYADQSESADHLRIYCFHRWIYSIYTWRSGTAVNCFFTTLCKKQIMWKMYYKSECVCV